MKYIKIFENYSSARNWERSAEYGYPNVVLTLDVVVPGGQGLIYNFMRKR